MTHGIILKHLLQGQVRSIQTQLFSRFLSFYFDVSHSDNKYVSMCSSLCKLSRTNAASNRRLLLYKLNNNGECFSDSNVSSIRRKLFKLSDCSDECKVIGRCVKELCLMRDGYYQPIFDQSTQLNFVHELCVN